MNQNIRLVELDRRHMRCTHRGWGSRDLLCHFSSFLPFVLKFFWFYNILDTVLILMVPSLPACYLLLMDTPPSNAQPVEFTGYLLKRNTCVLLSLVNRCISSYFSQGTTSFCHATNAIYVVCQKGSSSQYTTFLFNRSLMNFLIKYLE